MNDEVSPCVASLNKFRESFWHKSAINADEWQTKHSPFSHYFTPFLLQIMVITQLQVFVFG